MKIVYDLHKKNSTSFYAKEIQIEFYLTTILNEENFGQERGN